MIPAWQVFFVYILYLVFAIWIYVNAKSRNIKAAIWWAIGSFMLGIFGVLLYYLLILRPDKKGLHNKQLILQGSETLPSYPQASLTDANNHISQTQQPSPFQENTQLADQKKPKDIKKTIFLALFCIVLIAVGALTLISGIKQFNGSKDTVSIQSNVQDVPSEEVCDRNGYCTKPNPDIKYAKDGVLEIEEHGIKIILDDDVKDAMYAVDPGNGSIVFSTQGLASVAKGCNLEIMHILVTDYYSITGDYYLTTFSDPEGTELSAGYLKNIESYPAAVKINDSYYHITPGHSSCMGSDYDDKFATTIDYGFLNSNIVALDSTEKPAKEGYVFIADWGVYIGLGEYSDKVSVSEVNFYGEDESTIMVTAKTQYGYYQNCETSIGISRIKDISDFDSPPDIKLGDYYYRNNGVSECGGATESGNQNTVSSKDLINAFKSNGVKE